MKFLFDFFPVLLFFITFKLYDDYKEGMMAATAVIIVAVTLQVAITYFKNKSIEKMHIITLVLVILFGGATLILQDELFFKWKPTVANWIFAAAFLGSHFIGKKTLVERMMASQIAAPHTVFNRLNMAWVIFFTLMGIINLYVIYNFDTNTWVNFKFYGLIGLTILFVIGQGFYLIRYMEETEESDSNTPDSQNEEES